MGENSADIPKYIPEQKLNPPAITEIADISSLYPKEVQEILGKVEGGINHIVSGNETKKEISELNENFKKNFIEKLKKLPDYKGSKVQEAIEKGIIEIKKIPGRDGYAIYESKVGNLVYITRLDGTRYTNIDKYRTKEMLSDIFEAGYIRQGYGKIELINGLWKLFDKKGKEIPVFSDEYSIATLNAINTMWDFVSYFEKIVKEREGN